MAAKVFSTTQTYEKPGFRIKVFMFVLLAAGLCLTLSGCRQSTPEHYWTDAKACLDDLRAVQDQIDSGRSHEQVAPYVVKAKITVQDFEKNHARHGVPELNREIRASLDAYLDAFVVDDTIFLNRPILQGSLIQQQLIARYPEIADRKDQSTGGLDAPAVLAIVRKKAQQHAEAVAKLIDSQEQITATLVAGNASKI